MAAADAVQRVAPHHSHHRGALLFVGVGLRRQARQEHGRFRAVRKAESDPAGDELGSGPDGVPQRGIELLQHGCGHPQLSGGSGGVQIKRQLDLLVQQGPLHFQFPEVASVVLRHFAGGEKFRVEVLAGKLEAPPIVRFDQLCEVTRTHALRNAQQALGTVIVCRDRQRPATQLLVDLTQELGGGFRSDDGIQPLIVLVADGHEYPSRGARELPDAGCAVFGAGRVIERGFHVREENQIFGHPVLGQIGSHLVQYRPGTDQPIAEAVG